MRVRCIPSEITIFHILRFYFLSNHLWHRTYKECQKDPELLLLLWEEVRRESDVFSHRQNHNLFQSSFQDAAGFRDSLFYKEQEQIEMLKALSSVVEHSELQNVFDKGQSRAQQQGPR